MTQTHEFVIRIRVEIEPQNTAKTPDLVFEPKTADESRLMKRGRPLKRSASQCLRLLGSKGLTYSEWRRQAKWALDWSASTFGRLLRQVRHQGLVYQKGSKYYALTGEGTDQGAGFHNPSTIVEGYGPSAQGPVPNSTTSSESQPGGIRNA